MRSINLQPVPRIMHAIVHQHVEEAASLHAIRSALAHAPHVKLSKLGGFDERLAAHLEGLQIAGAAAEPMCAAALETGGASAVFVATMRALESRDLTSLQHLLAIGETLRGCRRALISAFGWTDKAQLRGIVPDLLGSASAFARLVGVAACGVHRVDPGLTAASRLEDESPLVRARAWRTAGEIGKRECVSTAAAVMDDDPECQFWAAWSAVVLGDKHNALEVIAGFAAVPGHFRSRAFQLVLQARAPQSAHGWLAALGQEPGNRRWLIRGAGLAGDSRYAAWLIGQMADDKTARLAGESFSLVTGLDIAWHNLDRPRPADFERVPNDDPNDPNVEMDEDDGLPWPDQKLIQRWWSANSHRFSSGVRYFMGEPLNRENCLRVLKEGFQRQRIAAALYLSLLNPGNVLFNTSAPAWRQQRLLATMT
jgi:uncharacterized protein (TIGR02270 family)